jgi:hypothetical protein
LGLGGMHFILVFDEPLPCDIGHAMLFATTREEVSQLPSLA